MKQAVKIIEEFINTIILEENVLLSEINDGRTSIFVDDIYHLTKGMTVNIDGLNYTVFSSDASADTFTIAEEITNPQKVTIPNPFYFYGTPFATNTLISDANFNEKFPMIYLYELLKDDKITDDLSLIDRKIKIRMFFLDNSQGEFTTEDHYNFVINGIGKYLSRFEDELDKYPLFVAESISKIERFPHANFGKFLDLQGYTGHIFNEVVSGIEIRFELPVKKSLGCD